MSLVARCESGVAIKPHGEVGLKAPKRLKHKEQNPISQWHGPGGKDARGLFEIHLVR